MQRMLFMPEMVMTMMGIGCVWSSLGAEDQGALEEATVVAVVAEGVIEVAEAGDHLPGVPSTEFL
jgi:hypothetical protein